MRKIGTLESAKAAEKFHRFLLSEGIENRVEHVPPDWEVWVINDDELDRARNELDSFKNFPDDKRFQVKHVPQQNRDVQRPRRRPTSSYAIPATRFFLVGCVMMTLYTGLGVRRADVMEWIVFSLQDKVPGSWLPPPEIMNGEVWRIFTPMFVHGSFFHLFFNMYWLWILGNTIERTQGTATFVMICLISAAGGHFTEYYISGPNFIGFSGVAYGLFGYVWMKSLVSPEEGFFMPDSIVYIMLGWLILGISGILESWGMNIANGAHFGGMLSGMLLGCFPRRS